MQFLEKPIFYLCLLNSFVLLSFANSKTDNMIVRKKTKPFHFKQFSISQDRCAMKVGTDGVLLGAWVDVEAASTILDIGAGTGLIAIMMAQRTTNSLIDAVEIDIEAFEQATENMQDSPWSKRLNAIHIAIQDYTQATAKQYDLIVSNPPFFSGGTFSNTENRNLVRHTVKLPNGDLLASVRSLLTQNGKFSVILPTLEGLRFQERAQNYRLYCTKMTEIKPKRDKSVERILLQFEKEAKPLIKNSLIIQFEERNHFTDEYIALTGDFYLKM